MKKLLTILCILTSTSIFASNCFDSESISGLKENAKLMITINGLQLGYGLHDDYGLNYEFRIGAKLFTYQMITQENGQTSYTSTNMLGDYVYDLGESVPVIIPKSSPKTTIYKDIENESLVIIGEDLNSLLTKVSNPKYAKINIHFVEDDGITSDDNFLSTSLSIASLRSLVLNQELTLGQDYIVSNDHQSKLTFNLQVSCK